ncbi:MAG: FAD-dependent oxidoreductase [Nanoarchaeota archaeon]
MPKNPCIDFPDVFVVLQNDASCDVVIVGAGIAGISCAYHLQQAGYSVIVLEKDVVGSGATGGSSGILYYGSGTNFTQAKELYGPKKASLLWKETDQTIKDIINIIEKNKLDCGLRKIGGIMVAKNNDQVDLLKQEACNLAGLNIPTIPLTPAQLNKHYTLQAFEAGLYFTDVVQIDPAHFVSELARHFNIPLYEKSPMISYEQQGDVVVVKSQAAKITAKHLIIASNLEPLFGLEKQWKMEGSVIMASQALSKEEQLRIWPTQSIIWTMEHEYDIIYPHYERAILELYRFKDVDQKIARYYPGVEYRIDKRWGGTWAKTNDFMPFVGSVTSRIHVAVAMGDQGIVMGWTAGSKIQAVIKEKKDPLLEMMSIKRFE